jgi:hypothetical protein
VNVSPPPPALRDVVPPGYRLRLPGPAAVPERAGIHAGDILTDLHHLECTLRDLGQAPPSGAGIAAAARVLAE